MAKGEAYRILDSVLGRVQRNDRLRKTLAGVLALALLVVAGDFLYDLMPRQYRLTITGGDILSNRHHLAKVMQEEAADLGLGLDIQPVHGSVEALSRVNEGKLDVAIVQGGLDLRFPHVRHVATLAPELIHVLVRPGIASVEDVRGKVVGLGSRSGGTRIVATEILRFSGLEVGIDYVEVNHSAEELLALRADKLPDVVVNVSTVPSYLADFLVRERGYALLEMPFPKALALRQGWVADTSILGYAYSVAPPVPPRTISTIGVNLHVVANENVEPRAVFTLLSTLFSPAVAARVKGGFDEARIMVPSGFPVSAGTELFLVRNQPLLSAQLWEYAQSAFGLIMSALSTALVVFKWFKGAPPPVVRDDDRFLSWLAEMGEMEAGLRDGLASSQLEEVEARLAAIQGEALGAAPSANLTDPRLLQDVLMAALALRTRLSHMRERVTAYPA